MTIEQLNKANELTKNHEESQKEMKYMVMTLNELGMNTTNDNLLSIIARTKKEVNQLIEKDNEFYEHRLQEI